MKLQRVCFALFAFGLFSLQAVTPLRSEEPAFPPGKEGPFPDALNTPLPDWDGPTFVLSQRYPSAVIAEQLPWRNWEPSERKLEYLKAVLTYCIEGNENLLKPESTFNVQDNTVRKWYHAPWMHWVPYTPPGTENSGREFVHGLTRERTSKPQELHPNQVDRYQNWAVGAYNNPGGYTVGRVWQNPAKPDASLADFPEGTVSFKLLFTEAPVDVVPYLQGAPEWKAQINVNQGNRVERVSKPVALRLLQVDVAVRHKKVDNLTGWVFGTFMYHKDGDFQTPWGKLRPVGLMWGNDPNSTGPLSETFVYKPQEYGIHLGWQGRLNGPVDNPASTCLSCHSTAQYRFSAPMLPQASPDSENMKPYLRNLPSNEAFSGSNNTSLHYSLQLAQGIYDQEAYKELHGPQATPGFMLESEPKKVYLPSRGE